MPFRHDPLQDPRDIRLLRVFRRTRFGKRCCEINHVSVDKLRCTYTAISYTWGDSTARKSFPCADGRSIAITESVACLLEYLALESDDFTIWLDAICINQSDISEKEHQVRLMRDIYASATQVLVWLGGPSGDSSSAFLQIKRLAKYYKDHPNTDFKSSQDGIQFLENLPPDWKPLEALLRRPWFQRIWVLQEVALGKSCIVACGRDRVDWDLFAHSIRCVVDLNLFRLIQTSGIAPGVTATATMAHLRELWINGKPRPIEHLLVWAHYFVATDDRDKVFGLLGAATDASDEALNPSYSESPEETYIRVYKTLAARSENLLYLKISGVGLSGRLSTLPSWVPDLTASPPAAPLGINQYHASDMSTPQTQILDQNRLAVRGIILDTLDSPGLCLHKGESSIEYIARVHEFVTKKATLLEPYPTAESRHEVFWRTIIANDDGHQVPSSPSYGSYAQCYLSRLQQSPSEHQLECGSHNVKCCRFYKDRFQSVLDASAAFSRKVVATRRGYLGLTWRCAEDGDKVCIILGARVPFIIRENAVEEEEGVRTYTLVGGCYVHGLMNGEGLKMGEVEDIVLA
jgi:hypothetical protein